MQPPIGQRLHKRQIALCKLPSLMSLSIMESRLATKSSKTMRSLCPSQRLLTQLRPLPQLNSTFWMTLKLASMTNAALNVKISFESSLLYNISMLRS